MAYTFGSYQLDAFSGGHGNIVRSKNIPMPAVSPVVFTVARGDGVVKSGEIVNPRDIDVLLKIAASSRSDLISRLDALQKALALRGQALCIHEDGRIFQNVDCLSAETTLAGGADVQACNVPIKFRAYDPYAYKSTSSSQDTGTVTLTLASGVWNFAAISVTGGGTIYSFPLIRLANKTSTGSTTLTSARNSGSTYTTLPVNATSFSASVGDILQLSSGGNTQNVTVGTAFSAGATTLTVSSFVANATYAIGATVAKITQWTAITVSQSQDSSTLTTYSTASVPLPNLNNEYVDIQCDPASGMSIESNGSGELHDPVGVFPVIQPDATTFNISIACQSEVKAQAVFSWTSRYLS